MHRLDLFKDIFFHLNKKTIQFLLSDEENQFISFIYSTAETYIRETEPNEFKNEHYFKEKVAETRNVLEDVLLRFQKTDEARSEFLDKFPPWAEYRKTTVEELNAIADAIHSDKFKGNVSKMFGGFLGVFGGAALLASVACPPLLIAGGVATALSLTSSIGTAVTETVYLKSRLEQAKIVLEKDQEQFKSLQEWFDRSSDLMEAINDIFGFNLMNTMQTEMKLLCTEFIKFKSQLNKNEMYKLLPYLTDVIRILCSGHLIARFGIDLAAVMISFILPMLITVVNLYDRIILIGNLTFGLSSSISAVMRFKGLSTMKKSMGGAMSRAATVSGKAPRVASRLVKAAPGIGIALDSITILLAANDVRKGSLSEQGKELKEVTEQLQKEFDFIQNVYNELKKRNLE